MKKLFIILFVSSLTLPLLNGCAGVVIGGAATGVSVIHDRRSAGTVLDDQAIELKALTRFFQNKPIHNSTHLNVTAYNGKVLLTGEAPSEALRSKVVSLVKNIPKVKLVHNEISLAAPSALMSRSSDSYVTSKVKVSLFNIRDIRGFDPTRVKVVTENGSVYLMGLLWRAEVEPVIETIRRVGGVQRVVKLFDYVD